MRPGVIFAGIVGSVVIGIVFWLALFGLVQLNRPMPMQMPMGPGVMPAPAPQPAALAAAPVVASQAQQVKIVATDLKFDQKEIKVAAGQPVELTLENKGVLEHDFTLQS